MSLYGGPPRPGHPKWSPDVVVREAPPSKPASDYPPRKSKPFPSATTRAFADDTDDGDDDASR